MSELSPRQRMINMMYLVLTALLALNISKEVLEAFKTMDNSIEYSYTEKFEFNQMQYDAFAQRAANNPEKLGIWNDYAQEVKKESAKLIGVINEIKDAFEATGLDEDGMLEKKDQKELVIHMLVSEEGKKGSLGYGRKLKSAREEYKHFLLSLDSLGIYEGADSILKTDINILFKTADVIDPTGVKEPMSWEKAKYYQHVPQAVLAFMAQDKLDVGNMEGAILEVLQKKTGQSSITVNSQLGVVTSTKQSIMLGDSFHARVFIAGVDTNQLPKFNVYQYDTEGNRVDPTVVKDTLLVDGSEGVFSVKPNKQGTYWLGGDILVQSEEGEKTYEFKQQYRVDAAMSVISPDKMNVLYTEVVNPLSISVPGYSSDELQLYSDFSDCKIKRIKNGSYEAVIAKAQRGKNARKNINLFIKHKKTGKLVGKKIGFRIKNVPPPRAAIRNKLGPQSLSTQELALTGGITAKQENFDFALEYEITSYDFSYQSNTGATITSSYKGWRFDPVRAAFNGLRPGQKIIFDNFEFKVKGSKNKPRKLYESVVITIL